MCGWRSSAGSTAAESLASTRFRMRNWQRWRGVGSIRCGSSAYGSAAVPRRPLSNSAATRMQWPRPTRSSTTPSPKIWAARQPTSTCATAPITMAFGWPAIWCPTIWASTRPGLSSIPSGSSLAKTRPIPPTASTAPISPTMRGPRSKLRTTTLSRPTPRWSFAGATATPAKPATFITATMAPAFPGMTRHSSTT